MKPSSFAALAVVTVLAMVVAIATYGAQNRWSQAKVSGASLASRALPPRRRRIARIELKQGDKTLALARDKDELDARRPRRLSGQGRCGARAAGQARPGRAGRAARPATRSATPCSSWRTRRPRTPSRASCACSTTRAPRSPRPSSARSASMRSAPARAAPTCASPATRRPGSAMPISTSSSAVRDWVQPGVLDLARRQDRQASTIEIPGEEPLVIARDDKDASKHTLGGIPEGKKLKEGAGIDGIVRACRRRSSWRTCASRRRAGAGGEASVAKIEADGGLAVTLAAAQGGRGLLARARGHRRRRRQEDRRRDHPPSRRAGSSRSPPPRRRRS